MNQSIYNLKRKFNYIKKLNYVKAVNNYNSGIGLTLEKLLGKEADNFSIADYDGIELKTKLEYSKKPINLFKLTPEGKDFFEIKRIYNNYGYYRSFDKEFKVFNGSVTSKIINKIGLYYYFTLNVNYKDKKIELIVYDFSGKIIDKDTYWTFEKLENALNRKLNYLAIIKVWDTEKNKQKYYKYYKITFYKLISFENFLKLVEAGKIYIVFSIDIFKSKKRYGQIHDHGTSFSIFEKDLEGLFVKLDI